MKFYLILIVFIFTNFFCASQKDISQKVFTHADTIRGSITPERAWWNVLKYDITTRPDYLTKTTAGSNRITYKVVGDNFSRGMQIDLQEPLHIDSVIYLSKQKLSYRKENNVWYVSVPSQKKFSVNYIDIYFSGKPQEGARPPWQGGWTFTKDSFGRPWMMVTCQGIGASVWYPCKDHQSDEPDMGASLTMVVPDTLVGVANGRLQYRKENSDGTATYKWAVTNPINNYNIIPYIGKYVSFNNTYNGEKGSLPLNYWVMDYNLNKARAYMPTNVKNMLRCFEYWLGPYPFYEDGYKLVEVPYAGMEHQSAIAYGNGYSLGYYKRDRSGTGWGLKYDYIIVHESGHEWFGNNITTKDIADMWVHEGFTSYSETLYVDYMFGKNAGDEFNAGLRKAINNDKPIILRYGVNEEGSGDMYNKGANMLHTIRHSMNNDVLFRQILKGLNKTFYHQTVTSLQVESYISTHAGYNYSKVFDQYLRTIQIPRLEYYFSKDRRSISYRWTNCVKGFNLPLVVSNATESIQIIPASDWRSTVVKPMQAQLFNASAIEKKYYVNAAEVSSKAIK